MLWGTERRRSRSARRAARQLLAGRLMRRRPQQAVGGRRATFSGFEVSCMSGVRPWEGRAARECGAAAVLRICGGVSARAFVAWHMSTEAWISLDPSGAIAEDRASLAPGSLPQVLARACRVTRRHTTACSTPDAATLCRSTTYTTCATAATLRTRSNTQSSVGCGTAAMAPPFWGFRCLDLLFPDAPSFPLPSFSVCGCLSPSTS